MVKLLVQVVLSKIRVLFLGKEPVHIKPFISKKMKYEIGDRGVVATISYFVNNSHTSYNFFSLWNKFGSVIVYYVYV